MPRAVRFITRGQPSSRERMLFSLVMMLALVVVGLALVAAQARAIRWIDRNGT